MAKTAPKPRRASPAKAKPTPTKAKAAPKHRRIAANASGFDAASSGRRTSNWNAPGASINALLQAALPLMRDRARDQERNNPWVKKAIRSFVGAVIGTGIMPIA